MTVELSSLDVKVFYAAGAPAPVARLGLSDCNVDKLSLSRLEK